MNRSLLSALILILLISKPSLAVFDFDRAIEVDAGVSSPGKGLIGVRFWPMQSFSVGAIMGTLPVYGYTDLGFAYSIHFFGANGLYAFQAFHWLNSGKKFGHVIEMDTGAGYQVYGLFKGFIGYAELGFPLYISDDIYRNYKEGEPRNRIGTNNNTVVLFTLRAGLGVGYIFSL
jgi:hypothetical protein